ncbi:type II toxin-antitoxin system PrlF family antitoxin [Salmonella enterica]|nr:type II toxin-antitoxin system PrlF family antitoxin [Salmonella enterica]
MSIETERKFAELLDKDMEQNPSNVHPAGEMFSKIRELTQSVEVDLDAELTDD